MATNERNGYTLNVGKEAPRFYYGKGAALDRAVRVGSRLALRLNLDRFFITDAISAKTWEYEVTVRRLK